MHQKGRGKQAEDAREHDHGKEMPEADHVDRRQRQERQKHDVD